MSDITTRIQMVINNNYGGYGLSRAAAEQVAARKGLKTRIVDGQLFVGEGWDSVSSTVPRHDPVLVAVVREMGALAGRDLEVVEVEVSIEIDCYDGKESIRVSGGVVR